MYVLTNFSLSLIISHLLISKWIQRIWRRSLAVPRTSSRSSWFECSIESCRGERGLRRRKWRNLSTQRSKWEADRLATWWGCRSGGSVCGPAHSCPTLCDPIDCSLSGSSVHGIFPGKILEWVAISSSRGSSWPRDRTRVSCIFCIGRWVLFHCATWEAQELSQGHWYKAEESQLLSSSSCSQEWCRGLWILGWNSWSFA